MNAKLMIASCLATFAPSAAHADAVSDRVLLVTGAPGCPSGSTGFKRIRQAPDGSQVNEANEFVVPASSYLEITSIEWTTPYWTQYANGYVQQLLLNIRQRYGSAQTNVFTASFSNAPMFSEDDEAKLHDVDTHTSPGARTRVAAFPVGPLMSSAGRLCLSSHANFFNFGGSLRVRGRLIPAGGMVMPSPQSVSW